MATFLSIPDVVWSGVVGATITLLGVGISNRGNTNRLKLQLKNDSAEKVRARLAELRRDVYLEFAEQLVVASDHVGSLPDWEFKNGNVHQKLAGFFAASSKLQLICSEDTADLAAELTGKFQAIVLKSTNRAVALFNVKSQIDLVDSAFQQYESEVKRVLAAMAAFNESAQTDQKIFAALQRAYDFNQSQVVEQGTLRNKLWTKRNELHIEYARATLADLANSRAGHRTGDGCDSARA